MCTPVHTLLKISSPCCYCQGAMDYENAKITQLVQKMPGIILKLLKLDNMEEEEVHRSITLWLFILNHNEYYQLLHMLFCVNSSLFQLKKNRGCLYPNLSLAGSAYASQICALFAFSAVDIVIRFSLYLNTLHHLFYFGRQPIGFAQKPLVKWEKLSAILDLGGGCDTWYTAW